MTINDTRKPTTVTFGGLNAGQCFIDQEDGSYCMVLEADPCDENNAVDLESGRLYYFYSDQEVVKINTRLEVF